MYDNIDRFVNNHCFSNIKIRLISISNIDVRNNDPYVYANCCKSLKWTVSTSVRRHIL